MTHDPSRERHMTHLCENCDKPSPDLIYRRTLDEYWCGFCIDNEASDKEQRHDLYS